MSASRSSTVALCCVLLAPLVFPTSARAEDGSRVLLAKLAAEGVDETLAAQVDVGLRREMENVVHARLIKEEPMVPDGCDGGACAASLAGRFDASLVVIAVVRKDGDGHSLVARLVDAEGNRIVVAERSFSTTPDFRVLRGLATQLLVPGQYTGRVRFTDTPDDAQVLVDGIPLAGADLAQAMALSVGEHRVVVERSGEPPLVREVSVAFDKESEVSLAPPPPEGPTAEVAVQPPLWPALTAAGVAGAGVLALIGGAVDLVATTWLLDAWYQKLDTDRTGFSPRSYGEQLGTRLREDYGAGRRGQRNDYVLMAAAGGVVVVAGTAAAVLLTDWALRSSSEAEE